MQIDKHAEELRAVESRVSDAAPGEPTDVQLDRARAKVAPRRSRGRVAARVTSAVVALALVGIAIVVTSQDSSTPAFAYESAANTLMPHDGVLHAVTVMETLLPELGYAGELTPDGEVPDYIGEQWIDAANDRYRTEARLEGTDGPPLSATVEVGGRQRTLYDFSVPGGPTDRLIEEGPADEEEEPLSLEFVIERMSQGIRTGDCEVVEELTEAGDAAWRVSWDYEGMDYTLHTQAVLRQTDYRPLFFEHEVRSRNTTFTPMARFDIVEWETVAYKNVPVGLFDLDSVDDPRAKKSIEYAPEDPRLTGFSEFPAWHLGADSAAGPLAGGKYVDWFYMDETNLDAPPTRSVTFTYGNSRLRGPSALSSPTTGCAVTTFAWGDTATVEGQWQAQQGSVDNHISGGEINGIEYRVNTLTGFYSWALMTIEGHMVEIIAPDEPTVLEAIAELEPL